MTANLSTAKGKKKFGQNLNKALVAEDTELKTATTTTNRNNENNGMLLMSTSKRTTMGGSTTSNTIGGGGGSSTSNSSSIPRNSNNIKKATTISSASSSLFFTAQSQHDALLNAIGASTTKTVVAVPDAWTKQPPPPPIQTNRVTTVHPMEMNTETSSAKKNVVLEKIGETTTVVPSLSSSSSVPSSSSAVPLSEMKKKSNLIQNTDPKWNEYGGRGDMSSHSQILVTANKKEKEMMLQRAKEKIQARQQEEEIRTAAIRERAQQRLKELDASSSSKTNNNNNNNNGSNGRTKKEGKLWDPATNTMEDVEKKQVQALEEVPSKDDNVIHLQSYEDRSRGVVDSSTPRMLYDPATGSMVAVKANKKSSNIKRRVNSNQNKSNRNGESEAPSNCNSTTTNNNINSTSSSNSTNKTNKNGAKQVFTTEGKKKDRWNKTRKDVKKVNGSSSASSRRGRSGRGKVDNDYNDSSVALYTGYGAVTQPELGMQTISNTIINTTTTPMNYAVIKGNDKMELLVDAADSPTLKPTAKEFAPSQAALAAAAAAAANLSASEDEDDDEMGDDIIDDDDDGLGFDPTGALMDGLIENHALDLDALKLSTPALDSSEPRHIFAFGSSGTWGGASETSDWSKVPIGGGTGGLFGGGSGSSGIDSTFGLHHASNKNERNTTDSSFTLGDSWGTAFGSSIVHNGNQKTGG